MVTHSRSFYKITIFTQSVKALSKLFQGNPTMFSQSRPAPLCRHYTVNCNSKSVNAVTQSAWKQTIAPARALTNKCRMFRRKENPPYYNKNRPPLGGRTRRGQPIVRELACLFYFLYNII